MPGAHVLEASQVIPRTVDEVFAFFCDPRNLERITPPWLRFRVVSGAEGPLAAGHLITYRLRLHGIPLVWTSRISAWEPPHRFVDEQVRGPYREWVHEHTFAACAEGTRAGDRVRYRVPGGRLVDRLFVRRDVERIFSFRAEALRGIFGATARKP